MDNYQVRPNENYCIDHLSLLLSSLLNNDISIDKFRIIISSSENSKKFYQPNDMNHLSVSTGVWTAEQPKKTLSILVGPAQPSFWNGIHAIPL